MGVDGGGRDGRGWTGWTGMDGDAPAVAGKYGGEKRRGSHASPEGYAGQGEKGFVDNWLLFSFYY